MIEQPKNAHFMIGQSKVSLIYNQNLAKNLNRNILEKQKYIDNQCITLMEAYTPLRTGILKNSPLQQSNIGSGVIYQYTPYARKQYYTNKGTGLRGKMWFHRMVQAHRRDILKGVEKI